MNVKFSNGFRKSVTASGSRVTLPRSKGKDLINYKIKMRSEKAVTIDGVEYGVPDGYTLRDNEVSTATAFYCTRDSDDATGTLNLTTGVFTASTFTPGKTTKTVNAHGVPLEYQEVTYLKSNGNGEYIYTGIIPVQGDDVSVDIYDFQTFQTGGRNLLGLTYYGEWSSAKGWYVGIAGQSGKNAWNCRPTVSPDPTYNALGITTGHSYKLSINGNGYYVDDVCKITLGSLIQTIDTGKSLWLFAVNGGTPTYNSGIWAYGVTDIKVNGVLVRRFVPVKRLSDDAYGMYDLVTNAFFGNEGDGAFTGGSANQLEVPLFHYRGVGDKTANEFNKDDSSILNSFMIHGSSVSSHTDNKGFSLKLTEGETYTVSKSNMGRIYVGASANPFANGTDDHLPLLVQKSSASNATFTVPLGKPYIDIVYWHRINDAGYTESDVRDTLMLVKGTTAPTEHIPFGYDHHIVTATGIEETHLADYHIYTDEQGFSVYGGATIPCDTINTYGLYYYARNDANTGNIFHCMTILDGCEEEKFNGCYVDGLNTLTETIEYVEEMPLNTCTVFNACFRMVLDGPELDEETQIEEIHIEEEKARAFIAGKTLYYQTDAQSTWVAPLFDTLSYLGGEVLNIGHTTLSAGTHSITGAKTNGRYQTSLGTVGTLSGTSITIPSGYGDVEVLFELETPVTKQIAAPRIPTVIGDAHFEVLTTTVPSEVMLIGRSGVA